MSALPAIMRLILICPILFSGAHVFAMVNAALMTKQRQNQSDCRGFMADPVGMEQIFAIRDELLALTTNSGAKRHPTTIYSRIALRFLAGREDLAAFQKVVIYRDFAQRMSEITNQMWKANEYGLPTKEGFGPDTLFIGFGHYLVIRAKDGTLFTGEEDYQPGLESFRKGLNPTFKFDYSLAKKMVDPKQLLPELNGLFESSNTSEYQKAIAALEELRGVRLLKTEYLELQERLSELYARRRLKEAEGIMNSVATFYGYDAVQFLLKAFEQFPDMRAGILISLGTRKIARYEGRLLLHFGFEQRGKAVKQKDWIYLINLAAQNKNPLVTDTLTEVLNLLAPHSIEWNLIFQILESRGLDQSQKNRLQKAAAGSLENLHLY